MPLIDRFFHGGGVNVPSIFGNGSDGDLHIAAGETVTLPVERPHKDIIIKEYKSIHIETGGTLTTSAPNCGLVLRCKGDCVIDGVIDQSGKGGYTNYDNNFEYPAIMCGAGGNGGAGGKGGYVGVGTYLEPAAGGPANEGAPPRPYGGGFGSTGSGGGGGNGINGMTNGKYNHVKGTSGIVGNSSNETPQLGGAGGDGGGTGSSANYGKGGIGGNGGDNPKDSFAGGIILLYVGGSLIHRGGIYCNGNSGADGENGRDTTGVYNHGGGGGGGGGSGGNGGGAIYICHNDAYLNTGELRVNGGTGGVGGTGGTSSKYPSNDSERGKSGSPGTAGAIGQVKVVKYEEGMTV